jgi:hypothetical protein
LKTTAPGPPKTMSHNFPSHL